MVRKIHLLASTTVVGAALCMAGASPALANYSQQDGSDYDRGWEKNDKQCRPESRMLAGDFHQHTLYTDGSTSFAFAMEKNNEFGLDWWANSEHGGAEIAMARGISGSTPTSTPRTRFWETILQHGNMYRWQSLRDFVYPDILKSSCPLSGKTNLFRGRVERSGP